MVCFDCQLLAQVKQLFFMLCLRLVVALKCRAMEDLAASVSGQTFEDVEEEGLCYAIVCFKWGGNKWEIESLQKVPRDYQLCLKDRQVHLVESQSDCRRGVDSKFHSLESFEKDVACSMSVWHASFTACQGIDEILKNDGDEDMHLSDCQIQSLKKAHLVLDCVLQWDSHYDLAGVYRAMESVYHMKQSSKEGSLALNRLTKILNNVTDCLTWMIQLDVAYGDRVGYCKQLERLWLLETFESSGNYAQFQSRMLNSYKKCIPCQFPSNSSTRNYKRSRDVRGASLKSER